MNKSFKKKRKKCGKKRKNKKLALVTGFLLKIVEGFVVTVITTEMLNLINKFLNLHQSKYFVYDIRTV